MAHALELDVSSCGGTKEKALKNLKEAVRLFLEEAEKMGTLKQILRRSRLQQEQSENREPKFHQCPASDSPAFADTCQSLALSPINNSSKFSKPMGSVVCAPKVITWCSPSQALYDRS